MMRAVNGDTAHIPRFESRLQTHRGSFLDEIGKRDPQRDMRFVRARRSGLHLDVYVIVASAFRLLPAICPRKN